MITRGQAKQLGALLRKMVSDMPDEDAVSYTAFIKSWAANTRYQAGDRVKYNGVVYNVLQAHTSQADWTPDVAASLFAKVLIPTDEEGQQTEIPDWEQPDSTNPYMIGDQVRFDGHIYESIIDGNVWSPSAYPAGWKLVE
ncbi:MAG: hypothetical protein IJV59_03085 [Eubacterium sp.]|nr:hypothetical protein [Eubacterium sp.]MBQ9643630.1 hypothetical protein [Lachnospiraceae bacterium]